MTAIDPGIVFDLAAPLGGVKESGFGRRRWETRHRGIPNEQGMQYAILVHDLKVERL